jgi:alpha-1,3-glucosyltransferase
MYWGLDYPPLTAYVSWGFGKISQYIYPELVNLHTSKGHESKTGKTFMRVSVLMCDIMILFPAFIYLLKLLLVTTYPKSLQQLNHNQIYNYNLLICLLCPALILIDHGHFQYNCVSIGFALLGALSILHDCDIYGSILFCLSLNFKQIALYYSPIFFVVLLRKCYLRLYKSSMDQTQSISLGYMHMFYHLFKIGSTVIVTFAIHWLPFCFEDISNPSSRTCIASLSQILFRIFPFNRGLFEDKVSNFWYSISVVSDIRFLYSQEILIRISLCLTVVLLLPILIHLLFTNITPRKMILSLVNSSLIFFMVSFHVHEKSLLYAIVPASLLFSKDPVFIGWFQIMGAFTMYPLLLRDNQYIPYFCCLAIFSIISTIISHIPTDNKIHENLFFKHPLSFISYINIFYLVISAAGNE